MAAEDNIRKVTHLQKLADAKKLGGGDAIELRAGALSAIVDQSIAALARHAHERQLYQRGEQLVRPGLVDGFGFQEADGTRPVRQSLRLKTLTPAILRAELSRIADYCKVSGKGERTPADCPRDVALTVLESSDRWRDIPAIVSVSEVPLFDGRALYCGPGVLSGVYVVAPKIALPTKLSKDVAAAALIRVERWLDEFEYVDAKLDGAAMVALMLTAALRQSLATAPGFIISKHSHSAGATTAAKMAGVIATGREPAVMPCSDEQELRKQLGASLISGDQLRILDNLPDGTELRSPLYAQILSEREVKVRILGESREVLCPTTALDVVTGVNVQTAADLNRRFIHINLDPKRVDPEARAFKRKALLHELAQARSDVLRDLYIIAAAYGASEEKADVGALGSYEHWVRLVAEPLAWLGRDNVLRTVRAATNADPIVTMLRRVIPLLVKLTALLGATGGLRVSEMIEHEAIDVKHKHVNSDAIRKVRSALRAVLGEATKARRFQDEWQLDPRVIGLWLARVNGRLIAIDGVTQRIMRGSMSDGMQTWCIKTLSQGQL